MTLLSKVFFANFIFLPCLGYSEEITEEIKHKFDLTHIYSFDLVGSSVEEGDGASWRFHSSTRLLLLDFLSSDSFVINKFDEDSKVFIRNFIIKNFTKKGYIEFCHSHIGNIDTVEIQGDPATAAFLIQGGSSNLVIKMPREEIFSATRDELAAKKQVDAIIEDFVEQLYP